MKASSTGLIKEKPSVAYNAKSGQVIMQNGRLELIVETQGEWNPRLLRDIQSGRTYADGSYAWQGNDQPVLTEAPFIITEADGTYTVKLRGKLGGVGIEQILILPVGEPGVLKEVIRLYNSGTETVDTSLFACGFTKQIHDGNDWLPAAAQERFCDVPYRHHPETGDLCDYTMVELATKNNWFSTARSPDYNIEHTAI